MAVSLLQKYKGVKSKWGAVDPQSADTFSVFHPGEFFAVKTRDTMRIVADMPVCKVLMDATPRAGALESGTLNMVLAKPKEPAHARYFAGPKDIVVTRRYEVLESSGGLQCVFDAPLHPDVSHVKYMAPCDGHV